MSRMNNIIHVIKATKRWLILKSSYMIGTCTRGAITSVKTKQKIAALTFDDGPHPVYTLKILDLLKKYDAFATFFLVGKNASRHPKIVKEIGLDGHSIGNHSWNHASLPSMPRKERRAQIHSCAEAVAPYGQKLLRPPFGHLDIASHFDVLTLGYQIITWDVAAFDWVDHDAEWIANRIIEKIKPGSIILLHDCIYQSRQIAAPYDRSQMLTALEMVLSQLSDQFSFVTIPNLLKHGRPRRVKWYVTDHDDW